MNAASTNTPRGRLRSATHAAHGRVDACFPRGLADAADYRRYLRGMHAVVDALERALHVAHAPSWASWRMPERVVWLREDLGALGAEPLDAGPMLPIASPAQVAGALYVVEGSALGATQLLHDARALGWTEQVGARFLHGHAGDDNRRRWREYVDRLEAARFDPQEEAELFDAAARTFAYAEHEFLRAGTRERADV